MVNSLFSLATSTLTPASTNRGRFSLLLPLLECSREAGVLLSFGSRASPDRPSDWLVISGEYAKSGAPGDLQVLRVGDLQLASALDEEGASAGVIPARILLRSGAVAVALHHAATREKRREYSGEPLL
jgi:hypothetical protein